MKAIGETSLRNRIRVSLFLDSLLFVSIASFFLTDYEHEEYVKIFVFFLIIMVWCSSHRSPPKVYCKIDLASPRSLAIKKVVRNVLFLPLIILLASKEDFWSVDYGGFPIIFIFSVIPLADKLPLLFGRNQSMMDTLLKVNITNSRNSETSSLKVGSCAVESMGFSLSKRILAFFSDFLILCFIIFVSRFLEFNGYFVAGPSIGVFFILLNFYFFKQSLGKRIFQIKMKNFGEGKLLVRNVPGVSLGIVACLPDEVFSMIDMIDYFSQALVILSVADKVPVLFSRKGSIIDRILKIEFYVDR